jgi:hypothetical protein
MADVVFADGLHWEEGGYPDFVKGRLAIHAKKFQAFCEEHKNERGYVYVQLLESKAGNMYLSLDTYRKEPEPVNKEMQDGKTYKPVNWPEGQERPVGPTEPPPF